MHERVTELSNSNLSFFENLNFISMQFSNAVNDEFGFGIFFKGSKGGCVLESKFYNMLSPTVVRNQPNSFIPP